MRLWDIATAIVASQPSFRSSAKPAFAFSPNAQLSAISQVANAKPKGYSVKICETSTGMQIFEFACESEAKGLRFTPDGKSIVSAHTGSLCLWDLETGRKLKGFTTSAGNLLPVFGSVQLAISSDGRNVAATTTSASTLAPSSIVIWEITTGQERACFSETRAEVQCIAFEPDCRLIASGSDTILTWDLTSLSPDGQWTPRDNSQEELEHFWADLGGDDAVKAYRAMWSLAAAEQGPDFLTKVVYPVTKADPATIARLIADLDSDQFAVRTQASNELMDLAELAEPAARKVLAASPIAEARRRLEKLVLAAQSNTPTGDQLRLLRTIEALENAGTSEAMRVLEVVAGGAAEARVTRETQAALARLVKTKGT